MTIQSPTPLLAFQVTYPFDASNGAQADMILRSSDGVDFRIMKGVLAVSSPIFQDMTTLAKPLTLEGKRASAEVSEDGLPIVVMYESNAVVLDALLRILYPVVPPKLDDLDLISSLLRAAQKYDMSVVLHIVEDALRKAVTENNGEHAMEVYLIACEYRLEEIMRLAVNEFLKCPLQPTYFPGLEKASASTLFHLFDHRRKVADTIDVLFAPLRSSILAHQLRFFARDIECSTKNTKPAEGCGSNESGYNISSWWAALRVSARSEIQKAPLSDNAINIGIISDAVCSSKCCSNCKDRVFRQLPVLETTIKHEIRRIASEVKFELPW